MLSKRQIKALLASDDAALAVYTLADDAFFWAMFPCIGFMAWLCLIIVGFLSWAIPVQILAGILGAIALYVMYSICKRSSRRKVGELRGMLESDSSTLPIVERLESMDPSLASIWRQIRA